MKHPTNLILSTILLCAVAFATTSCEKQVKIEKDTYLEQVTLQKNQELRNVNNDEFLTGEYKRR